MSFQGHTGMTYITSVAHACFAIKGNMSKGELVGTSLYENGTTLYNFPHPGTTMVQPPASISNSIHPSIKNCMTKRSMLLRSSPHESYRACSFRPLPGSYAGSLILLNNIDIIIVEVEGKEKS